MVRALPDGHPDHELGVIEREQPFHRVLVLGSCGVKDRQSLAEEMV
jgi:hypothetical protein